MSLPPSQIAGCAFCDRVVAGEYTPTTVGPVVRFEPLNPVTPGHMLFLPRAHRTDAATDPFMTGRVSEAAARYAADQRFDHGDFNLITSAGTAATQTVWHLHVHYVPRNAGDGLRLPWTGADADKGHAGKAPAAYKPPARK